MTTPGLEDFSGLSLRLTKPAQRTLLRYPWWCAMVFAAAGVDCAGGQEEPRTAYLEAALQVANWLDSTAILDRGRAKWSAVPGESKEPSFDLYHGAAGIAVFYLRLYGVTRDRVHLDWARAALAGIVDQLELAETNASAEPGLYTGVAGFGRVFCQAWTVTGERRYRDAANRCVALLARRAIELDGSGGIKWNEVTDMISGSAGIGTFLLQAAQQVDNQQAIDMAIGCADGLLSAAIKVPLDNGKTGFKWMMNPDDPREMPNYSHGTAGICDFLLRLNQVAQSSGRIAGDDDQRFRSAAEKGAAYLESIANTDGGQCLIMHHRPGGEQLYYLGWCHGPAGTGRLFLRLGQDGKSPERWERLALGGAQALIEMEIATRRTPGFWNNVGLCCGSCGAAQFLLEIHQRVHRVSGDQRYLTLAVAVMDDVIERAEKIELDDGRVGLRWVHAEHRARPDLLQAQTGMMQGAAGVGIALLDLHQAVSDVRQP